MLIFRVFEPQSWLSFSLNWVVSVLVVLSVPSGFWVAKNDRSWFYKTLVLSLSQNLNANTRKFFSPGGVLLYVALLLLLLLRNLVGLIPYVFTSSRHLTFTLALSLPLWAGHYFYSWLKNPESMLAHLVPSGTPRALMSFIVLIELIRRAIRPITLSVRLAANIIAGHLLLTLISSAACFSPLIVFVLTGILALAVLESAVALIQAYVFSILSVLYVEEVSSPKLYYSCSLIKMLSCGLSDVRWKRRYRA